MQLSCVAHLYVRHSEEQVACGFNNAKCLNFISIDSLNELSLMPNVITAQVCDATVGAQMFAARSIKNIYIS